MPSAIEAVAAKLAAHLPPLRDPRAQLDVRDSRCRAAKDHGEKNRWHAPRQSPQMLPILGTKSKARTSGGTALQALAPPNTSSGCALITFLKSLGQSSKTLSQAKTANWVDCQRRCTNNMQRPSHYRSPAATGDIVILAPIRDQ